MKVGIWHLSFAWFTSLILLASGCNNSGDIDDQKARLGQQDKSNSSDETNVKQNLADPFSYGIVASEALLASDWKQVVTALQQKYPEAKVYSYKTDINEVKTELSKNLPRYVCFVERPPVNKSFIMNKVIPFMRNLDADPYEDAIWAILTGYNLENALQIANAAPLEISNAISHVSNGYLNWFESGVSWNEGVKNAKYIKEPGKPVEQVKGPDDTTQEFVEALNANDKQCMSSSGHASQHDWMMGYSYSDGTLNSKAGKLFGKDTKGKTYPVTTTNPKIYLGVGNCLIADQADMDSMSLAWLNSGANQFFGHVQPQSKQCVAWDVIKFFFGLQDRFSYSEAIYLNRQAARTHPANWSGCLNITTLYGDPAWQAHMKRATTPMYDQNLTYADKGDGTYEFTFKIKMNMDTTLWRTESAADFLPFRIKNPKMVSCGGDECKVADNLVILRKTGSLTKDSEYTFVFEAAKMGEGEIFEGDKMGSMLGTVPLPEKFSE